MALPNRKSGYETDYARTEAEQAEVIPMPAPESTYNERQARQPALRLGEVLKRERERRGYDIQQIADYLCIRRTLLTALENSRYEEFPADAYVIGFLRSYAEIIGLDGQEAINYYRQEMAGRRKKPDLVLPTPISETRAPTSVIMGAAALVSLLIYIVWYAFSTTDRAVVTTPPPLPTVSETASPAVTTQLATDAPSGIAIAGPAPTQKALDPLPAANATPTPTTTATVTPDAPHVVVKADQASWILVADSKGQTLYDHVMKPGEIYEIPNQEGLTLTTGNGAGIVLTLDGIDLPRLSTSTTRMLRNIPLDPKSLKSLPPKPAL